MSATYTEQGTVGPFVLVKVEADDSYPTGGYTGLPLRTGGHVLDVGSPDGYQVSYDRGNKKLRFRVGTTGAEVGSGVDLTGKVALVLLA
jgi:hypothetical protein